MVNWYGAESPDYVVGGLKYQPITTIINEIVSMGFNGVRLPWSNQMWQSNPVVSGHSGHGQPAVRRRARPHHLRAGRAGSRERRADGDPRRPQQQRRVVLLEPPTGTRSGTTPAYPQSAWLSDWKSVAAQFDSDPAGDRRGPAQRAARRRRPGAAVPRTNWQAAAELGGDAVQSVDPQPAGLRRGHQLRHRPVRRGQPAGQADRGRPRRLRGARLRLRHQGHQLRRLGVARSSPTGATWSARTRCGSASSAPATPPKLRVQR